MKKIEKLELENLIDEGLSLKEIAKYLNISYSTIIRLCNKYNLKSKFNELKSELINCLECDLPFNGNIKEKRKFCSKSCSVTFNNKVRIITEDTKIKTSNTLKNKPKKEKVIKEKIKIKKEKVIKEKIKKEKVTKERTCRNCDNLILRKYKIICDTCRVDYYEYYRPSSNFDFSINIYKDKFDLSLVEKYGWYSPFNKGNNLNGVSKDHLFSVKDGFINKVSIDVIKHPANCRLMIHRDNQVKNSKSIITLDELLKRIKEW